jgi:hypothetical protein
LLLDLGVPVETIAEGCAASQEHLWPLYEKLVAAAGSEPALDPRLKPVASLETMQAMFAHLAAHLAGCTATLRQRT